MELLKQDCTHPPEKQSHFSKVIAQAWRDEPEEVKEKWFKEAAKAKQQHLIDYPDYKYCPRRSKKRPDRDPIKDTDSDATVELEWQLFQPEQGEQLEQGDQTELGDQLEQEDQLVEEAQPEQEDYYAGDQLTDTGQFGIIGFTEETDYITVPTSSLCASCLEKHMHTPSVIPKI